MAEIEIQCPYCGETLEASEDMAGETVDCPACSKPIRIEVAAEEDTDKEECPECGEPMADGAVLCVACGYHSKLGRKIDTDFA